MLRKTSFASLLAVAVLFLVAPVSRAQAVVSQFDLPSQPLAAALRAVGSQTSMNVLFDPPLVEGRDAPALKAELTVDQAFARLLAGSGLKHRFLDDKTVMVISAAATAPVSRPTAGTSEAGVMRLAQTDNPQNQNSSESPSDAQVEKNKENNSSASSDAEENQLEEIVVTATKRSERVQDVPISIAVVGADDIDKRGLVGAADYLRGMPGVNQTEVGYGGQAIIIRGLETTNSFLNFSGGTTVGNYFGETPTTNSAGLLGSSVDIKLVDIERVEVLRGPQGTAFGSSSMGGTVRIIPAAPRTDRFEGKLGAGYSATSAGGGDNYSLHAAANIPLIADKLAVRAVAYQFSDSGFYENRAGSNAAFQAGFVDTWGVQDFATDEDGVGSSNTAGGRIAALFQATDALSVTLSYLNQKTETDGYPIANSGKYRQTLTQVAPVHVFRGEKGGINDNEIELVNAVVDYDFGWTNLLASYSYLEGESEHALVAPLFAGLNLPVSFHQFSPHRERSGEARLVTKFEGPWNFLAGVFADKHEDQYLVDWNWFADLSLNPFSPQNERDLIDYVDRRNLEQKSAFAEVTWDFLPKFSLTAGARAYDYERRTRIAQTGPLLAGATIVTDDMTDESGTTYRANLSFKPADASLLYAAWSQGFRLGRPQPPVPASACDINPTDGLIDGTNVPIDSTGSVGSDDVDSYELGAKVALLERRLTVDAAVFRMDWNNIPVQFLSLCPYAFTTNAGKARSKGVELQANLQVAESFLVTVGGSWNEAELLTDVPAQGFSAGDALPGTPKESANLGLQYSFDLAGHPAFVRADSIYVGRFYGDIPQSPNQRTGDYTKINAAARMELGSLAVDLYVHNLTDEDAFTSRGNGLDVFYGYRLRPRTIGFQLGYDF